MGVLDNFMVAPDISMLEKVRIQAQVLLPVMRALRADLGREQADAYWLAVLAEDKVRSGYAGNSHAGDATDKLSSRNRHWTLPGRHKRVSADFVFVD